MQGITITYAIFHDLNQPFSNLIPVKSVVTRIRVSEMIPVVIRPIIKANATFFFFILKIMQVEKLWDMRSFSV